MAEEKDTAAPPYPAYDEFLRDMSEENYEAAMVEIEREIDNIEQCDCEFWDCGHSPDDPNCNDDCVNPDCEIHEPGHPSGLAEQRMNIRFREERIDWLWGGELRETLLRQWDSVIRHEGADTREMVTTLLAAHPEGMNAEVYEMRCDLARQVLPLMDKIPALGEELRNHVAEKGMDGFELLKLYQVQLSKVYWLRWGCCESDAAKCPEKERLSIEGLNSAAERQERIINGEYILL